MTLTIGSLFAGIGGIDLGLEAAGLGPVRWQVEKSEFCKKVLRRHWPEALIFDDVQNVGKHNLPPVDVICGGFPCQDISYAGKGAGLSGKRSGLWYEFARVIGEMEPRYVVVENVPALLTRGIDQVLGTLADLGYDAEWRTISAAELGAPHLRRRVFIVAYATAGRCQQRDPRLREDGLAGEGHLPLGNTQGGGRGAGGGEPAQWADGGRPELGDSDSSDTRRLPEREKEEQPVAPIRSGVMGHTNGLRELQPEGSLAGIRRWAGDGNEELGDTDRAGLIEQRRPEPVRPEQRPPQRRGREIHRWEDATPCTGADGTIRLIPKEAAETGSQSPLRSVADGLPDRLAGRVTPRLWPVSEGEPGRVARLSAIGNAVVPAVAAVIGWRIREMEAEG